MSFEPIRNSGRAKQLVSFDGMEMGDRLWPTDFDAVIDWHDEAWMLFEVKHRDAPFPKGQRLAYERFVADCRKTGKLAVAAVVEHKVDDPQDDVRLADCDVREVYVSVDRGKSWRPPKHPLTAGSAMASTIDYVDGRR